MKSLRVLFNDRRASSAAEFALVLPLLLIFLIGIIDVGRLLWTINRVEKATQMGVRYAIVTTPVPAKLSNLSASKVSGVGLTDSSGKVLTSGDSLDQYDMGKFTYSIASNDSETAAPTCQFTAPATNCNFLGSISTTSFDAIYNWMKNFLPELKRKNIEISYSNSGLGYAGDPTGRDFYPVVTVSVKNLAFQPRSLAVFGTSFTLRTISAALTMEDGQGSASN
ncbi:TadE/TadG family type IV pilus assembly protein [Sphingobium chlorophenolicum]|uniref:Tight adherance protein TadE n=1 Tax=Sphingobium chlorophenolicum TaxID=46429 RepID=A0A081RG41_SPHCR|nr:TadE/TadG family type IV pilus assembly protein [Sphingobium chlorophenolicum]KEQ54164.1 Tight adherance protein TadE [Sphingobium chlorophenolicum]